MVQHTYLYICISTRRMEEIRIREIRSIISISTTHAIIRAILSNATMLLPILLFSILASIKAMPNLLVLDQSDNSIYHEISAIKEFADPQLIQAVHPDAELTTLELVDKYNYNGQLHTVTTSDGYILELHQLKGRTNSNDSHIQKPVAFVMHGLLCSSACWVLNGPEKGLAYVLSDAGYDVWLGNARGTLYSRKHVSLSVLDKEYWDFR